MKNLIYLERRSGSTYRAPILDITLGRMTDADLAIHPDTPSYDIEYHSQWDGRIHIIHTYGDHIRVLQGGKLKAFKGEI
jgi:hypothetical protein